MENWELSTLISNEYLISMVLTKSVCNYKTMALCVGYGY